MESWGRSRRVLSIARSKPTIERMVSRFVMCRYLLSAAAVALFAFAVAAGEAQVAPPLSEVRVTVVDVAGAVITGTEVTFKGESKTVVSRTGNDGSVTLTLPRGRYAVSASHLGFLKNDALSQSVTAGSNELRIVLQVRDCGNNSCICMFDCAGPLPELEPTTSDLPNVITSDEPSPVPPTLPATAPAINKTRSLRCLYLWKCSAS